MQPFKASIRAYEDWLRDRLRGALVEKDLDRKHEKMKGSAFAFLRATYWRWAETILDLCPELVGAPAVLAVGDTHLENFGTWRDEEGRLIWGANDFDDAAPMPYVLDLVRLAASALLARTEHWQVITLPPGERSAGRSPRATPGGWRIRPRSCSSARIPRCAATSC